ncbi:MAG: PAS domain-containing sensor histidine kinase [Deltaproteobacteria bacterium]|nr:PAS domain-containing sensor histidine kinase [Deltaproteobacteria bacterium]
MADPQRTDLQRYFETAKTFFLELDLEGTVIWLNDYGSSLLGYPRGALAGKNWFDACLPPRLRPEIRASFQALIHRAPATPIRYETPLLTREGDERILSWHQTPLHNHAGDTVGSLISGLDVTEQRAAERALQRTVRELADHKAALDASAIVATTDATGRMTYVNDRFCEISKFTREELLGRDHRIINSGYHPKSFMADLWSTIRSGEVWRGDICNRAKDGRLYWVSTTIMPFLDESSEPQQFMAIRFEITQRKLAEEALERTVLELKDANKRIREEQAKLIQAEKLSSIGLLASGVAHEVNNPLSGVMACVKALADESIPLSRRPEYFRTARDGLERIQQIVRSLLDYARQRAPAPSEVDVSDVISDSLRLIAPALRKRRLEIRAAVDHVTLYADRSQLMQGIINLLMNAVQASSPGGEIGLATEIEAHRVGISIVDRGPGMPEDVLRRACDPFFTTKSEGEGTGLGLAVTLSIARSHGGDLDIESTVGKGTAVTLWLPKTQEDQDHARYSARG